MIGLILFIGICLYEYHVRGLQAALSYAIGIAMVTWAISQGLPFWVGFIWVVLLCIIIGRLPKKV
jgi:hypothetical protein